MQARRRLVAAPDKFKGTATAAEIAAAACRAAEAAGWDAEALPMEFAYRARRGPKGRAMRCYMPVPRRRSTSGSAAPAFVEA